MRGALGVVAVLILLASVGFALPDGAKASGNAFVNVVGARDLGCSPDEVTSPDLRVTVLVDGSPAIQTGKAQDEDEPLYAQLDAVASPSAPVHVQIQVEEAEPGGFFFLGTDWRGCDAAPGSPTAYTFSWDGSLQTVVARGDSPNAAEATVVLGPGAPAVPAPTISNVQPTAVTVSWDPAPGASHRVAWGNLGAVVGDVQAGTSSYGLAGLCEDVDYAVRVVRDAEPWHVASPDLAFRTANLPPAPPAVRWADPVNGSIQVMADLPASHDLASLDVFGGPTPDVPLAGTPLAHVDSDFWSSWWSGTAAGSPAYVVVRVTDVGGLSAASPAFQVGSPHQSSPAGFDTCPRTRTAQAPAAGPSGSSSSSTSSSSSSSSSASSSSSSQTTSSRSLTTGVVVPDVHGRTVNTIPHAETKTVTHDSGPSIPLNATTFTIAAVAAVALGAVIGLALRRR